VFEVATLGTQNLLKSLAIVVSFIVLLCYIYKLFISLLVMFYYCKPPLPFDNPPLKFLATERSPKSSELPTEAIVIKSI